MAAKLTAHNVAALHDAGQVDGQLFIDMELIDGVNLAELIAETGPQVEESDGACRSGEPEAGKWWPEYALGLVPE